ncbi:hypoxanthine phosphoribosyltransferase [Candidatus Amarolinea dominans]|uniref:hypoxanthine phosphoribosyltransferase n=1 Tax=Candidatus Amarolinea dominans TaxID=3140696 RepID=UPI0031CCBACC
MMGDAVSTPVGTEADILRVLIARDALSERVQALGAQISQDYAGRDLFLVAVLKGSVVFMADLIRAITVPHRIDFMATSSYGASTQSTGAVQIIKDLEESIEGRHVLIVEDIIDSGHTLAYLRRLLLARNPASLCICSLLDKKERREANVPVDYVGFVIPNEFVVGYGLDFNELYRNLPFIGVLKPEKYQA